MIATAWWMPPPSNNYFDGYVLVDPDNGDLDELDALCNTQTEATEALTESGYTMIGDWQLSADHVQYEVLVTKE